MTDIRKYSISALALLFLVLPGRVSAQNDVATHLLDSSSVVHRRHKSTMDGQMNDAIRWNPKEMSILPSINGSSDPMRSAMLLPGIQTNMDIDNGFHIQGCETMHNNIVVDGVPVYGAGHLLGLFSPFNTEYFSSVELSSRAPDANRLGGQVNLSIPKDVPERLEGMASIGLMALQARMRAPIGKKTVISMSARQSLLNELYGGKIKLEGMPLSYGFQDFNFSVLTKPSKKDIVWADFFLSRDAFSMADGYLLDGSMDLDWNNAYASLHWKHFFDGAEISTTAYSSQYSNFGSVSLLGLTMDLPSSIRTIGCESKFRSSRTEARLSLLHHNLLPQTPSMTGEYVFTELETHHQRVEQGATEATASVSTKRYLNVDLLLTAGLDAQLFLEDGSQKPKCYLSPSASLVYNLGDNGSLTATYALKRQFLFLTGLSNIGLPVEFWFLAGEVIEPQSSHNLDLTYARRFFDSKFGLETGLYYRSLSNQAEFFGSIWDLTDVNYDYQDYLNVGKGRNYGMNIRLSKDAGDLVGWLGYSFGRSLRKFDHYSDHFYPSNYERIHELDAALIYKRGAMTYSGTFVQATGTPFTPPKSYYLLAGNIVSLFGEHNSCRLRPYSRLDLSVGYDIPSKGTLKHHLAFSVHNVLCRKNDIFYRIKIDYNDKVSYLPFRYYLRFLPSLTYEIHF